ncbi:MAG: hypothetical protein IPH35_13405 [Rhodoferax sp.]|nr:hypothetical protein [Rhodoferax sp.]
MTTRPRYSLRQFSQDTSASDRNAAVNAPNDPAPSVHLVESVGSAASWVKWLLFIALASEFLVGWFRR